MTESTQSTPLGCAPSVLCAPCAVSADAPIGIFDSGIGGLSIALEIAQYLPHERIIYFADTANVPYGSREDHDIRKLTAKAIAWLDQQGCKIVVVACNTASAFSLDHLRAFYGDRLPIIGLVPALKPAVLQTKSKVVAVLATPATLRGRLILDVVHHFAEPAQVRVLDVTCLDLVPLIEAGAANSDLSLACLKNVLQPVVDQGADHLVLGCTHYPFLKASIEQLYSDQLKLVDSGAAVARQTAKMLIKYQILNPNLKQPELAIACYASGQNSAQLQPVISRLIDNQISWSIQDIVVTLQNQTTVIEANSG